MSILHAVPARKLLASAMLALSCSFGVISCNESSAPTGQPSTRVQIAQQALDHANVDWSDQPGFVRSAIAIQNRHQNDLLSLDGVVGTGVGLDEQNENQAVVLVFTDRENVQNIPHSIENTKVRVENVGKIKPFAGYTGTYRPVTMGVSVGNDNECASGTIGCLVSINGTRYMLSNNHVFARENAASLGERIDQPGRYDKQCGASGQVGSLADFEPVSSTTTNVIDAAIASLAPDISYSPAMASGYTPSTTTASPSVGLAVKKTGRTTGLTTGNISGINVTINVGYDFGTATFVNQIYVKGQFIKAGDSGSLMVTQSGNHPVGLDFAGGTNSAFANPIGPVLARFGATVIGN